MALKFSKLTRPAIRQLVAGQSIIEHGIKVSRLANGDARYTVNIMVDGQRIHRVIGRESEGTTREQAERAIEGFRTKAREGRLDLPNGRKVHRSFADAAEEYLRRIEHHPKHGRNFVRKAHHLRQRLAPYFKSQRPDKLTDFAVTHYIRKRQTEGAAGATINRELSTLSHFLSRCVEWGWSKSKPKIDKNPEPRKQITVLQQTDKERLSDAAVKDQDPLTWLFVAVAMGTAMRHSEILRVQWSEIQFDQQRIHIPKAKAGQREQPMPPSLASVLKHEWQKLDKPSGYLFPTARADAKQPHRQTMAKQFRRAVKRAGMDPAKVTPHVLRHTAITEMVKANIPLPMIQKVSGHKTLEMVLRYTQLSDDDVNEAVNVLDNTFSGSVTPELHTASIEERKGAA